MSTKNIAIIRKLLKKTVKPQDHRIIATMDAVDHPLSQAGDRENPLDHETACEDLGRYGTEIGDDRQDRIP